MSEDSDNEDSDNDEEPRWWPKKSDCSRLTIARSLLGLKALKVIPLNHVVHCQDVSPEPAKICVFTVPNILMNLN